MHGAPPEGHGHLIAYVHIHDDVAKVVFRHKSHVVMPAKPHLLEVRGSEVQIQIQIEIPDLIFWSSGLGQVQSKDPGSGNFTRISCKRC